MKNNNLKSKLKNTSGSVALIFAAVAAGAAILIGATVELIHLNDVKAKLDSIADAAALAGKKAESATRSDTATAHAAGEDAAAKSFNANKVQLAGLATNIRYTITWDSDDSVRFVADADSTTMLGGVFALNQGGSAIASIPIHAVSVATAGANQYVEIAMVLDNTGSMFSLDGRSESRFTISVSYTHLDVYKRQPSASYYQKTTKCPQILYMNANFLPFCAGCADSSIDR